MTEELKRTIEEQVALLPKEGQEALMSVDWVKIAEQIGKKFSLEDYELEDFQLETLLVLIGVTDAEFYALNIEKNVDITREKAEKIAEEGANKILLPIYRKAAEIMKNKIKFAPPDWQQNVEFVLSGGDYSSFMEKRGNIEEEETKERIVPVFSIKDENLKDKQN